jgi:hypothetical protein
MGHFESIQTKLIWAKNEIKNEKKTMQTITLSSLSNACY